MSPQDIIGKQKEWTKMSGRYIDESTKRKLYAESMGRCMNPNCRRELFCSNADISEKAHIEPYCATADNSFENLVLLCPNCHTEFDRNHSFMPEEVLGWKRIRRKELEEFFGKKVATFEELQKRVAPLLQENKTIFENYYLNGNRKLWDQFEGKVLANNRKLQQLLSANLCLLQSHPTKEYSNLACVQQFIAHVDEFEATRGDEEKVRQILFPRELNSIFGVAPVKEKMLPSTESLECLIQKLKEQNKFQSINMGIPHPYIVIREDGANKEVFLHDTPRLRQLYCNYGCSTGAKVRLDSLNYALRCVRAKKIKLVFLGTSNLREIMIQGTRILFVYEYCLSEADLMRLSPEENSIVVNLHNWNGDCCISAQAKQFARQINVTLFTRTEFYEYLDELQK